jgi:beta-glucosidase
LGTIHYVEGTQFLSKRAENVPESALSLDGKPGVRVSYSTSEGFQSFDRSRRPPILAERVENRIELGDSLPAPIESLKQFSVRWEGTLSAPETADYNVGMSANGSYRVSIDGQQVTEDFLPSPSEPKLGRVHLEKGKQYKIEASYTQPKDGKAIANLVWTKVNFAPQPEAISAARNADLVIAVVGITSELEGEEMPVNEPGFSHGDRTSLDMPKPEQDLLEALLETGKPLVVVLTNGSALAVNWANEHANAILDAWYPGEEGGTAVAETLSGKNNPAGRLPITFYTGVDQLPPFENYFMNNRTYRYFTGKPLYPFGYGLSYTTFRYTNLTTSPSLVKVGEPVTIQATVTNTGTLAGDEVAQLYLSFPDVKGAPIRALRGFRRIHLEPGASQQVRFELKERDLGMVTEAGDPIIAGGTYAVSIGGGQPNSGASEIAGTFSIKGTLKLPE